MATVDELNEVLTTLEKSLLAPLIPGELVSWAETAHRAASAAVPVIQERSEQDNVSDLAEIRREDPELSTEADKLAASGAALLEQGRRLCAELAKLCEVAPKVEPNEGPATSVAERISKNGIDLVIAARRQEEAIKAWLVEAVTRMNGNGD